MFSACKCLLLSRHTLEGAVVPRSCSCTGVSIYHHCCHYIPRQRHFRLGWHARVAFAACLLLINLELLTFFHVEFVFRLMVRTALYGFDHILFVHP